MSSVAPAPYIRSPQHTPPANRTVCEIVSQRGDFDLAFPIPLGQQLKEADELLNVGVGQASLRLRIVVLLHGLGFSLLVACHGGIVADPGI
jgi:hypothetical protein